MLRQVLLVEESRDRCRHSSSMIVARVIINEKGLHGCMAGEGPDPPHIAPCHIQRRRDGRMANALALAERECEQASERPPRPCRSYFRGPKDDVDMGEVGPPFVVSPPLPAPSEKSPFPLAAASAPT
jgi:hypothetical protein